MGGLVSTVTPTHQVRGQAQSSELADAVLGGLGLLLPRGAGLGLGTTENTATLMHTGVNGVFIERVSSFIREF